MQERNTADTRGPESLGHARTRGTDTRRKAVASATPAVYPGDPKVDLWVFSTRALDVGDGDPLPALKYARIRDRLRLERLRSAARCERAFWTEIDATKWKPKDLEPGITKAAPER